MTTPQTNFIGISVSGTHARAALVNDDGLVGQTKIGEIAPKTLIPQLAGMIQELRSLVTTLDGQLAAMKWLAQKQFRPKTEKIPPGQLALDLLMREPDLAHLIRIYAIDIPVFCLAQALQRNRLTLRGIEFVQRHVGEVRLPASGPLGTLQTPEADGVDQDVVGRVFLGQDAGHRRVDVARPGVLLRPVTRNTRIVRMVGGIPAIDLASTCELLHSLNRR